MGIKSYFVRLYEPRGLVGRTSEKPSTPLQRGQRFFDYLTNRVYIGGDAQSEEELQVQKCDVASFELVQSGVTEASITIVLDDPALDLSASILTRPSTGRTTLTKSGAFPASRTLVRAAVRPFVNGTEAFVRAVRTDVNAIDFYVYNLAGALTDNYALDVDVTIVRDGYEG